MPNIIDAFIVAIGLDPKDYKSGAAEVVKAQNDLKANTLKNANEVENQDKKRGQDWHKRNRDQLDANKKIGDSFGAIKREVVGAMAVMVGANSLSTFLGKTTGEFSNMSRAARAAGLSVAEFAAFGNVIAANGGSADAARSSLSNLSAVMEDYRTGLRIPSGEMLTGLNRIGAGPKDSAIDVYQKFANWAKGKDQRLVAQEGRMLGFDEGSIDVARKGGRAFQEAMKAARESLPTDEDTEKLEKLRQAWNKLGQDVKGTAIDIVTDVAPALTDFIEGLDVWVTTNDKLAKGLLEVGAALVALTAVPLGTGLLARIFGGGIAGEAGGGLLAGAGATISGMATPMAALWTLLPSAANAGEDTISAQNNAKWFGGKTGGVDARADQARRYFVSQGFTPAQAAGMVAGMRAENDTLDPHRKNSQGSGAYGVGQWMTARRNEFRKFSGHDIRQSTYEEQLAFIAHELRNNEAGAGRHIRNAQTSGQALFAYVDKYMRPGPGTMGDLRRGAKHLRQNVTIQNVNVHTRATDAKGISRDVRSHLAGDQRVAQANSGVR